MRALRFLLRLLLSVVAFAAVVVVLFYGVLREGLLENYLEQIIDRLAQKEGVFFVRAQGVSGDLPEHVLAKKVEVGDAYGVWLTVEDAEATWHPFDLFHAFDLVKWRIHVEDIHAGRVQWTRLPRDGPNEIDTPFRWDRFIRLIIGHLLVDDFELSGSILGGSQADFRVEGNGVLGEWDHGSVKLDIAHVDNRTGTARVDLSTHGSPLELAGTIRAEEGPGGALAALARLKDAGSVALSVEGSGLMHDWHAKADVNASNVGVLRAETSLAFNADGPFVVDGTFDPVPAQRKKYLVGDGAPMTLHAKGAWAPDVEVRIEQALLSADGRNLVADGRLDLATKEFHVGGRLVHERDGEPVHLTLLELTSASLDGHGLLTDGGSLEATLDIAHASKLDAASEGLHAIFRAKDPQGDGVPGFELSVDAKGLELADAVMPLFGADAHLSAAGKIDIDRGTVTTPRLVVDGNELSIEGPFAITEDWSGMTTSLRADASTLRSLSDLSRMSISGSATAQIDAEVKSGWEDTRVHASASASDVTVGESGWNALIGGATSLRLDLTSAGDGAAHGEMEVHSIGILASAKGDVATDGRTLSADAHVTMENLSRLSDPARAAIAGRLEATATARGTRDRFGVVASVAGNRVSYEGIHFDTLSADVNADGLPDAWSATVRSKGRYGQLDAALDANVSMPSDNRLLLRNVALRGPRTTGSADLDIDLARRAASGTVVLSSQDLSLWRPMTGAAIGGAIDLNATLAATGSSAATATQQVSGRAMVKNGSFVAGGSEVFVDVLDATADGVEISSTPRGTARVHLSRTRYGARNLVDGLITAVGNGREWDVETTADIRNGEKVKVSAAGTIAGGASITAGSAIDATLARTDASVDDHSLKLEQPARIRIERGGDVWSVDPLVVVLEKDGHVRGRLARASGTTRVDAEIAKLPLSLVSAFIPDLDLEGTVDGKVQLEGASLVLSKGEISLHGHDVASTGLEAEGVEPVDLEAALRLGDGRIAGSASVAGLTETRLRLSLDAPLVSTSSAAPVVVDLEWKGSIAEVAALLPIGEDTVSGRVDADLRLSGSVAAPRVTGRAVLDGAVWENATSGLVLRDMHAELEGAGTSIQLRQLDATDGEKGKFHATGGVRFEGFPKFDSTMNIEATGAILSRLDLLTTKADATLTVKASRSAEANASVDGSITGKVKLVDARVEIPQHLVADVPELDVIEVDTTAGDAIRQLPLPKRVALDLDIEVTGDNRIYVTGRGLESEWSSDVHIRGTSVDPRAQGNVTSVRGQLSLLGKRFDVTSATLHFDGERGNVPWLQMTARAEANDITAIAEVSGPATHPTIELRSEPSLPRDEVLSRLLFGQSAATLTPLQSVALARSIAELTGSPLAGGSGVLSNIGRTLGFDRLDIGSGNTGETALMAGRYLTNNVYLRVQQGLTPEASKLSLEWRVMKHITIESDVSQDAQGEAGVTWHWDY